MCVCVPKLKDHLTMTLFNTVCGEREREREKERDLARDVPLKSVFEILAVNQSRNIGTGIM